MADEFAEFGGQAEQPAADPFAEFGGGAIPASEPVAPTELVAQPEQQPVVEQQPETSFGDKALAFTQGLTRYMGGDFLREGGRRLVEGGAGMLGASPDVIADYNPFQTKEQVIANKEAAPVAALAGEVTGAIGGAIATRGFGGAKAADALSKALASVAARSTVQRLSVAAAALATEGAIGGAAMEVVRQADDAFLTSNYDALAEKSLPALLQETGKGALTNVAFGGAIGAAKLGIKKLIDAGAGDWVSGRAFKAVLQRSNSKGVKLADKRIPGGAAAVGKAMLEEGVVTPGATLEDIADNLATKRKEIGQALGEARETLGEAGAASRTGLWRHIDETVLEPLRKSPVKRSIAEALEAKLAPLRQELVDKAGQNIVRRAADGTESKLVRDAISFDEITQLRMDMDDVLRWESLSNNTGLEAYRDVRRAVNEFWMDSAEQAAEAAGNPELVQRIKGLTGRYAKVALADDLAQEAKQFRLANRFISPSDYGVGAAGSVIGALASGGATIPALASGAALGLANRVARERGNQIVAGGLHKLSKRLMRTQEAINSAAKLPNLLKSGAAATAAQSAMSRPAATLSFAGVDEALKQADELDKPESEASGELASAVNEVELELGPEMARAFEAKARARAEFLREKAGPKPPPGVFGGQPERQLDDDAKEQLKRYLDAADDPEAALKRLSDGDATPEDQDTLTTLYPSMLQEWKEKAVRTLGDVKDAPDYERQLEIAQVLGLALTADSDPESIAYWQQLSDAHAVEHEERKQQAANASASFKTPSSQSKADRMMA